MRMGRQSMAFALLAALSIVRPISSQIPSIDIGGILIGPDNPPSPSPSTLSSTESTVPSSSPSSPLGLNDQTPPIPFSGTTGVPIVESSSASSTSTTVSPIFVSTSSLGSTESSSRPTESSTVSATPSTRIESATTPRPGGHPPVLSDFDCSGVNTGYYANPKQACDTKFYICVDRSMFAYELRCPAKLYFDDELKICESWIHIPACSGRSRPTIDPRPETHFTLPPAAPVIDCYNLTDGNYPDPVSSPKAYCSNRFLTCVGRREFKFYCPRGLFYDHDRNQCDLYSRVYVCSGNRVPDEADITWAPPLTLPPVDFNCAGRPDGFYVTKCDSIYYSCNGGLARQFLCPDGLVFDSEWLSCEAPYNTLICSGTRRPLSPRPPPTVPHIVENTTPYPLNCRGRSDGIYRDPELRCSRKFYYCTHDDTVRNWCPGNLYFDDENKRCDLWINVFDCSGMRPTLKPSTTPMPSVLPAVDFDCTRREDGNYVNPIEKCSKFFYICANMESFQQYCPAGLYYNPEFNNCDSWANVYVCSNVTRRPTEFFSTTPPQQPEFDCSMRSDGVYTNVINSSCSGVYFRCVGGNTFKFYCPGGLFYDAAKDLCDLYEYVFACSGMTRPPYVSTNAPVKIPTERPPIDCRALPDGDYADPTVPNRCSHIFYTCSVGFAIKRECAERTYYDVELRGCDVFWNVPACTGSPRPVTQSLPVTERTTRAPFAFDCTRLHDGNYADKNCSGNYWSCVGGTTFERRCPLEFVYDAEFDDCEFPFMVPKCGGSRITVAPTGKTEPTTPIGNFNCAFLRDGNYVDPEARDGCSTIYYTCANGLTSRVHCQAGLFYDIVGNLCNSRDRVPACNGEAPRATTSTEAPRTESTSTSTLPPTTVVLTSSPSSSSSTTTVTSTSTVPSTSTSTTPQPTTLVQTSPTTESTTTTTTTIAPTTTTTTPAPAPTTAALPTTEAWFVVTKILQHNFTEIISEKVKGTPKPT